MHVRQQRITTDTNQTYGSLPSEKSLLEAGLRPRHAQREARATFVARRTRQNAGTVTPVTFNPAAEDGTPAGHDRCVYLQRFRGSIEVREGFDLPSIAEDRDLGRVDVLDVTGHSGFKHTTGIEDLKTRIDTSVAKSCTTDLAPGPKSPVYTGRWRSERGTKDGYREADRSLVYQPTVVIGSRFSPIYPEGLQPAISRASVTERGRYHSKSHTQSFLDSWDLQYIPVDINRDISAVQLRRAFQRNSIATFSRLDPFFEHLTSPHLASGREDDFWSYIQPDCLELSVNFRRSPRAVWPEAGDLDRETVLGRRPGRAGNPWP